MVKLEVDTDTDDNNVINLKEEDSDDDLYAEQMKQIADHFGNAQSFNVTSENGKNIDAWALVV